MHLLFISGCWDTIGVLSIHVRYSGSVWRVTFLGQQNGCLQSLEWVVPVSAFQARARGHLPALLTTHTPQTPTPISEQRLLLCSLHTFLGETLISALPYLGWRIVLREFPGKNAAAGTEVMEA